MTRSTSTGKIYDVNYIFGYIALKSAPYSQSLTVTNANGNSSPKIGSTDGFYFDFTISKSLWKSDIIEIVPDTNFGISSKVVCESASISFQKIGKFYVKISSYSKK
ncbi:unnamed protein product [Blepharisma stoltei]|uniref:Uncharacterized protein n=1 Tax=Blepharisma stoltei TaxID=1481888 RepID=A0AAU9K7J4_9CILI|nr:unnamed protein product [Blepharisma stoltei]